MTLDTQTIKIICKTINDLYLYRDYQIKHKKEDPIIFSVDDIVLFFGENSGNLCVTKKQLSIVLELLFNNDVLFRQGTADKKKYGFSFGGLRFIDSLGTFPD